MNVTIAWNVWNNYLDLKLGSEIARSINDEGRIFSKLNLISQGGHPDPPSDSDAKYIQKHFDISFDKNNSYIQNHIKYKGVNRVLRGILNAYKYASKVGSDFVVITNGDAWFLDLIKLKELFNHEKVKSSAISTRVGLVTGLDISWGNYVPFFDDHFIILNVPLCEKHGIFKKNRFKSFDPNLGNYGGIHYFLYALMDEIVPPGLFYPYTDLSGCVNHYGENCGFSLLPWQYQPKYGFLHANCEQEPFLHPLRAALLRRLKLDSYTETKKYCQDYPANNQIVAGMYSPKFRISLKDKLKIILPDIVNDILKDFLKEIKFKKFNKMKSLAYGRNVDPITHYNHYRCVKGLLISQRRPSIVTE
ncbi:hypothetical protein OAG73_01315 [bacterium]|nr:hypothetical protein [bacterium]